MSNDVDRAGPPEVLVRLHKCGLTNTPSDCAEQLAIVADAMARVASNMSWVAQYGDVEQDMRSALAQHAEEMDGAARLAESWANAIMAA